jgi:hypothetical protein
MDRERIIYIKRRFFSIKDLLDQNVINVLHLPTGMMIADLLTKPLLYKIHTKFTHAIMRGMFYQPNLASKGSVNYLSLNKPLDTRCQEERQYVIKHTLLEDQVEKKERSESSNLKPTVSIKKYATSMPR